MKQSKSMKPYTTLFFVLILSTIFPSAKSAGLLTNEGCVELVQHVYPSENFHKYCKHQFYRSLLTEALQKCTGGADKCFTEIMKRNSIPKDVEGIEMLMMRTNKLSNRKIGIVDVQKISQYFVETIDIVDPVGVRLTNETIDIPIHIPKEKRGVYAKVTFGSHMGKSILHGYYDVTTALFFSTRLEANPVPVYSNLLFTLTEISPKAACRKPGFLSVRRKAICKPVLTSSEHPSVDVLYVDKTTFRPLKFGESVQLRTAGNQIVEHHADQPAEGGDDDYLKLYGSNGGSFCLGRCRWAAPSSPKNVILYKMSGRDSIIRHGDIVSFCSGGTRSYTYTPKEEQGTGYGVDARYDKLPYCDEIGQKKRGGGSFRFNTAENDVEDLENRFSGGGRRPGFGGGGGRRPGFGRPKPKPKPKQPTTRDKWKDVVRRCKDRPAPVTRTVSCSRFRVKTERYA
ncbi:hypothetical protein PCE1_002672 [Barthelona sp. PCE]